MMVRRVAHRGIGVAAAPGQNGGAIDDEVAPAQQALVAREADKHDQQALARRSASACAPAALLGGAGHPGPALGIGRQPACERQGGPSHQPFMQILVRQAPQGAQQRQQQDGFLAIAAWPPAGTRRERGWAAVLGPVHGQPAQGQEAQSGDERESIKVQSWAALALGTLLGWRRDRNHASTRGRNHGLISFRRGRAAPGSQPIPFLQLCNALRKDIVLAAARNTLRRFSETRDSTNLSQLSIAERRRLLFDFGVRVTVRPIGKGKRNLVSERCDLSIDALARAPYHNARTVTKASRGTTAISTQANSS